MQILLIEDCNADATLIKLGFEHSAPAAVVTWVRTAEEGLETLYRFPRMYDLILLDLHLPRMSGTQFLAMVASDPLPVKIPVMILSSAPSSQVVGLPLGDRPVGYLAKPSSYAGFQRIGKYVYESWEKSVWEASSEVNVRFKIAR